MLMWTGIGFSFPVRDANYLYLTSGVYGLCVKSVLRFTVSGQQAIDSRKMTICEMLCSIKMGGQAGLEIA